MTPGTVAATSWLVWHMIQDRELLARAISEAHASRNLDTASPVFFDTTKLCSQPLLQSIYAETLRLHVAAFFSRRPDFGDTQVLDYKIPKDGFVVVDTVMAHMDKRYWNVGPKDEHPVESFWAERFLSNKSDSSRRPSIPPTTGTSSVSSRSDSTPATATVPLHDPSKPEFSLTGYNGAWIPFGGGTHQCPGRHWVKVRMLLAFAVVSSAFDIELLNEEQTLKVDTSKYGLGALPPAEQAKIRIRRKSTVNL